MTTQRSPRHRRRQRRTPPPPRAGVTGPGNGRTSTLLPSLKRDSWLELLVGKPDSSGERLFGAGGRRCGAAAERPRHGKAPSRPCPPLGGGADLLEDHDVWILLPQTAAAGAGTGREASPFRGDSARQLFVRLGEELRLALLASSRRLPALPVAHRVHAGADCFLSQEWARICRRRPSDSQRRPHGAQHPGQEQDRFFQSLARMLRVGASHPRNNGAAKGRKRAADPARGKAGARAAASLVTTLFYILDLLDLRVVGRQRLELWTRGLKVLSKPIRPNTAQQLNTLFFMHLRRAGSTAGVGDFGHLLEGSVPKVYQGGCSLNPALTDIGWHGRRRNQSV